MKRLLAAALAALCLAALPGCGASKPEESAPVQEEAPSPPPEPTPEELAAQEIDELLSSMTTEEKVGQLFFVRCPADAAVEDVTAYHLGGYVLFGRDFADKTADAVIQTLRDYQEAAAADTGIPMLLGVDEEGGTVVRVSSNPHLRGEKYRSPQKLLSAGGTEALVSDTVEKDALLSALGTFFPGKNMIHCSYSRKRQKGGPYETIACGGPGRSLPRRPARMRRIKAGRERSRSGRSSLPTS